MGASEDDPLLVVGDDPALDIALGRAVGAGTVLVLSGIAAGAEEQRPDAIVSGLDELLAALAPRPPAPPRPRSAGRRPRPDA